MAGVALNTKQKIALLLLADRTGWLTTAELRDLANRADFEDLELDHDLTTAQASTVGGQLVRKGFAVASLFSHPHKQYRATDAGRDRADAIRGMV